MATHSLKSALLRLTAGLLFFSSLASAQLQITTSSVPVAAQYQSYSTTLTASGGTLPYTWSVVSSTGVSLPEGMSLNPATGVVNAAQVNGQGGYAVTVQVADSGSPAPSVATATINFGVTSDSSYGGCQMFPPDSIYNQRIDLLPVDTNPSHQIPSSYLTSPIHPDFGHGFYPIPGGIPFMRVPANQPPINVNLANSGQIDANGTYAWPFPAWPNAVIEATSFGQDGIDHHILILQSSVNNISGPQTGPCTLYETYQDTAVPSMYDAGSRTWFLSAGLHYVLNSDEIAASTSTLDNGAQDSPGIPMVPLLLKYSEVPLGAQHPLRISFPPPTNWFVWPGTGCCTGSGPPQGLLYRIKASVNWQASCPVNLYPQAATVLQALQQYGAYMSDHGGTGFVGGVPDVRWNDDDLACIKRLHVSDLEVVDNSALEVSSISGQTRPYVVPAALPNGTVGTAYSATVSAVGGNPASRRWLVSSGSLPPGLLLDASTGTIGGTPTSSTGSPYSFSVILTDTSSGLASQTQFSIAVAGGNGVPPAASNLAQGKAATQSSTFPGYAGTGAASAVDGNQDGSFSDGSVTATNLDSNAWWQVDLGAPAAIGSIVIFNRTDCCGSRLNDYWVFVSDTPFLPGDTPAMLQNRPGTFSSHQTAAPNPSATIAAGTEGRYVRVQLTGTNYLSLAEVQVFGSSAPAVSNLAQGKSATQSSTFPGYASAGAASAVDGNQDGSFSDGSVTATNLDSNAWWQVDLGASAAIGSIVVWNRTDCCGSRLSDYFVFVSDTPFLPTDTPATLLNRPNTFSSFQAGAPNPSTTIAAVTQGRYVRVQLTIPNYLSLAEVQVFGPGAPAASNLAQGNAATQSSIFPGYATAGAASAVDGTTDGSFSDGSVTATNLDANAWWQVDLGASAAIGSIVVWNRTDCCGSRLNDYWVFVSDAPFLPTDTPATLQNRAGTFSSHQTNAPNPSATIAASTQGRYVRVQLTGTNYLSLAEVQVFGPGR
jgi:hypothetical protein